MASDTVAQAIEDHIRNTWSACPVAFENTDYEPPEQDTWAALEMSGDVYAQQSIGGGDQADNRWDEEGLLWFHIMVPVGTGGIEVRRVAKAAADLFRGVRLLDDTLEFMDASIGAGAKSVDDTKWWRVTVTIDWRRWDA